MNALHLPNAEFRSLAARVTDIAADLLAGLDDMRAFPPVRAEQVARAFGAPLPKTISGKIRRVELRKLEQARGTDATRRPQEFWEEDLR